MKKFNKVVAGTLMLLTASQPAISMADVFRYNYYVFNGQTAPLSGAGLPPNWTMATTLYGDWENTGSPYDCSNWSPSTSSVGKGAEFEQSASDCKQDQERWAQKRIQNTETGQYSNYEDRVIERQTVSGNDVRNAVGILENWFEISPAYTSWADTNSLYDCSSWLPSPSGYTQSTVFTQTSSTCKTDQSREKQDREQENNTGEIRNSGLPATETQTLTGQNASRSYTVALSDWSNTGEKTGCTNWSPAPETVDLDVEFTQTATDCSQPQERIRNEFYVDHKSGSPVILPQTTEQQNLSNQTDTKKAKGTKVPLTLDVSSTDSSFVGSPFAINWNGNGATEYLIRSNDSASGVSTTDSSMGTAKTKTVTATTAGNFPYTVTAKNNMGDSKSAQKTVAIENLPIYSNFTVNGQTSISVSPSASLSFAGSGLSAGSTLQGRNAANSADASLPTAAGNASGTTNYYAAAVKTLNGITKYSDTKSVAVTVVANPTLTISTAPATDVFSGAAFNLGWTGTDVSSYAIKGNNAASGVTTTDTNIGTATTRAITPTAVGTYTYTITATNAAGVTSTATKSVTVAADPTVTAFAASPTTVTAGENTTLSWTATGATLTIDQSVGTVTGSSKSVAVGTTAGAKTYTLTASTTLNGVTRTASKSASITVNAASVAECVYSATKPISYIDHQYSDGDMYTGVNYGESIYWKGTAIPNTNPEGATHNYNGYTYYKGTFKKSYAFDDDDDGSQDSTGYIYEVCRKAI